MFLGENFNYWFNFVTGKLFKVLKPRKSKLVGNVFGRKINDENKKTLNLLSTSVSKNNQEFVVLQVIL